MMTLMTLTHMYIFQIENLMHKMYRGSREFLLLHHQDQPNQKKRVDLSEYCKVCTHVVVANTLFSIFTGEDTADEKL